MMTFVKKQLNPAILRLAGQVDKALGLTQPALRADELEEMRAFTAADFEKWARREKIKAAGWGMLALAAAASVFVVPVVTMPYLVAVAVAGAAGGGMLENGLLRSKLVRAVGSVVERKLKAETTMAERERDGDTPKNRNRVVRGLQDYFAASARGNYDRMVEGAQAMGTTKLKSGIASRLEL